MVLVLIVIVPIVVVADVLDVKWFWIAEHKRPHALDGHVHIATFKEDVPTSGAIVTDFVSDAVIIAEVPLAAVSSLASALGDLSPTELQRGIRLLA